MKLGSDRKNFTIKILSTQRLALKLIWIGSDEKVNSFKNACDDDDDSDDFIEKQKQTPREKWEEANLIATSFTTSWGQTLNYELYQMSNWSII